MWLEKKKRKQTSNKPTEKILIAPEVTGSDTEADLRPDLNALLKNNCQQFSGDDCLSSLFHEGLVSDLFDVTRSGCLTESNKGFVTVSTQVATTLHLASAASIERFAACLH